MSIKIAVNGAAGRMAQELIAEISQHSSAQLNAALVRPKHRLVDRPAIIPASQDSDSTAVITYSDSPQVALRNSELIIDFSLPQATMALLPLALENKTPLLIGTTGFSEEQLIELKSAAQSIPLLLAPNTSIGVNSTLALLNQAAKLLGKQADIEIIESHHKHKLDAPSGTAIAIGETISEAMGEIFSAQMATSERFNGKARSSGEIGVSSIRAGEIIGEHKILFALDNETITIEHKALSRRCFSQGALLAGIWLSQQQTGLYTMQDFLTNKA